LIRGGDGKGVNWSESSSADWPAGKRYEVEVLPPPATELPADMSATELKLASTLLSGAKDAKQKG